MLLFLKRASLTPALPALALKLVNLVPPYMSLVVFKLLLLLWSSELVNL